MLKDEISFAVYLKSSHPSPVVISTVDQIKTQYPSLSFSLYSDIEGHQLETLSPVDLCQIHTYYCSFHSDREATHIHFCITLHQSYWTLSLHSWLNTMPCNSGYYLCPGIGESRSSSAKSIRKWAFLFKRVDHKDYQLWLPKPLVFKTWTHSPTCQKCIPL